MPPPLVLADAAKTFTMHLRDGLKLPVLEGVSFSVKAGECTVLGGPSGAGKSSILKMIYGNYSVDRGRIIVAHRGRPVDIARAGPRELLAVRRDTVGYVSQFLRALPRIAAVEVVAEPLVGQGVDRAAALARAATMLGRLNLPERLWRLPPATFSGGEQQRVNIARSLIADYPILLLDEPTASLDRANRDGVIDLIRQRRDQGTAIVGIFHDVAVRDAIATRTHNVALPGGAAA